MTPHFFQSQARSILGHSGNASGTAFDPKWIHENVVYVNCPWTLDMGAAHFGHIAIHKVCADSLGRVLSNVWDKLGKDDGAIRLHHYDRFSGSGCYRPMRGGSLLSMHGYYAAIDWDAPENGLHSQKHFFKPDELLLQSFRDEGWTCGIDWRGNSVDAMHVQFPRVD